MYSLAGLEPKAAAGVLSRLALGLANPWWDTSHDPSAKEIERKVLAEFRRSLHLDPDDDSPKAKERLADALDEEAARLVGLTGDGSLVDRLSAEGLLPSDVFEIHFDPQLEKEIPGWALEQQLAQQTIKHPHREQQFSKTQNHNGASNLARFFRHKFPARSFWLLLTGLRAGSALHVQQIPQDLPE